MTPRRPNSSAWRKLPRPPALEAQVTAWRFAGLRVISAADLMPSPVDRTPTATWHVSVSRPGGDVSDADLAVARRAFGMQAAEEDNHEPGRARHLFLPVDPAHRADCECNVTETTFTEPNGHRWKAPALGAAQRRHLMSRIWGQQIGSDR